MEKYDNLGPVGEGSYGMVLKCRHKDSGQLVAIKKFLDSDEDRMVKKIAMREVRMLRALRHENLVNLIEVFRKKKRLYLVFEFVDNTLLDELEKYPQGIDEIYHRKILYQVLRGTDFCHSHNIIHRDIKPENILISKSGVVKLCDFGFARTLAQPGEIYTDYVATRWYRAPELLVGDTRYGKAVDLWALGCLIAELLTGDPLFPGDSDLDQLHQIVKCLGNLKVKYKEIFLKNPGFAGMKCPEVGRVEPFEKRFKKCSVTLMDIMKKCLTLDADVRPECGDLLKHEFFCRDGFAQRFTQDLKLKIAKENENKPLSQKSSAKKEKEDSGKGSKKGKKDSLTRKPSFDEKDKKRSSENKKIPKTDKTPPSTGHMPPINNGHSKQTVERTKTILQPVTQGLRKGRADSTNSSDSSEITLKTEKSSLHERANPNKIAHHNNKSKQIDVRSSQDGSLLSLPELRGANENNYHSDPRSGKKSNVTITSLFESSPRPTAMSPGSLPSV